MAQRTVLLIDYEPRSIEDARRPLQEAGYQVEIANDGISGLEAFHRLQPDLVVVEAMLPKKHGFDVCQAIKNSPDGKDTPVVITTGVYRGRKYRNQALTNFRCDEYLEKPFTDEALLDACNRFIREVIVESASPDSPLAATRSGGNDLEAMTEDEISARLDSLLADFGAAIDEAAPSEEPVDSPAEAAPDEPSAVPAERDVDATPIAGPASTVFAEAPSKPAPPSTADVPAAPSSGSAPEPTSPETDDGAEGAPGPVEAAATSLDAPVAEPPHEPCAATPNVDSTSNGRRRARVVGSMAVVVLVAVAGGAWVWLGRGNDAPADSIPRVERATPTVLDAPPVTDTMFVGPPIEAAGEPAVADVTDAAESDAVVLASPEPTAAVVATVRDVGVPADDAAVRPTASKPPAPAEALPAPVPAVAKVEPTPQPAVQPTRLAAQDPSDAAPTDRIEDSTASPGVSADEAIDPVPKVTSPDAEPPGESIVAPPEPASVEPAVVDPGPAAVEAAEPPAVQVGDLFPLTEVDRAPSVIDNPTPEYDPMARQLRQQGTVVLNVLVSEDGSVEDVQVLREIPRSRLNDSAVRAVRRWRYEPAVKDGVRVKVWKTEAIHFRL